MVLSDKAIRQAYESGGLKIDPFEDKQVQPASYDLRVGRQGATIKDKEIIDISQKGFLTLDAGDAGLVSTEEIIELDNCHAGRFGLTSKYARKGVYATTGAQVDPGFRGRLFVGITNLTPKPLTFTYKDDFLTLELHKLIEPCERPYDGNYQGKETFGSEDVEYLFSSEGFAFSDVTKSLQVLSENVAQLSAQVKMLMWAVPIGFAILSIVVGILGIVIAD